MKPSFTNLVAIGLMVVSPAAGSICRPSKAVSLVSSVSSISSVLSVISSSASPSASSSSVVSSPSSSAAPSHSGLPVPSSPPTPPVPADCGVNHVFNPYFYSGSYGWTTSGSVTAPSTCASENEYSTCLDLYVFSGGVSIAQTMYGLGIGYSYTLSVTFTPISGSTYAVCTLQDYDSTGSPITYPTLSLDMSSPGIQRTMSKTFTAASESVTVTCTFYSAATMTAEITGMSLSVIC